MTQRVYEITEPRTGQVYTLTLTCYEISISFNIVSKSNEFDIYELSYYFLREFQDKHRIYTHFDSAKRIFDELCSIIELRNFDFIPDEGILIFRHINSYNEEMEIIFQLRLFLTQNILDIHCSN